MKSKREIVERIRSNIEKHGQHLYSVIGGPTPSFTYSIGVSLQTGFELVLAGYSYYSMEEAGWIVNAVAKELRQSLPRLRKQIRIDSLGTFTLGPVNASWSSLFLLGANDYFKKRSVKALQIIPAAKYRTIDHPDMSVRWSAKGAPIWQWLKKPWKYPVPEAAWAYTDLDVLQGHPVTEMTRCEKDQWEIFSCDPELIDKSEYRCVPLATLLAYDRTLAPAVSLRVGQGCGGYRGWSGMEAYSPRLEEEPGAKWRELLAQDQPHPT